jgi:hypothetical protein
MTHLLSVSEYYIEGGVGLNKELNNYLGIQNSETKRIKYAHTNKAN